MEVTLTYVNPRGNAVTFHTRRLPGGAHPPYLLTALEGAGGPPVEYESTPIAGGDGSCLGAPRYAARMLQTGCMIYGVTDAARDAALEALIGVLNPQLGEGALTYRNHRGAFTVAARVRALPSFVKDSKQGHWKPVLIDYECADPLWRGSSTFGVQVAASDSRFLLPFCLPLRLGTQSFAADAVNGSAVPAPVRIDICGPAVNPTLKNLTTGEALRVRRSVAPGETLTLITGPRLSASIAAADGSVRDAMNYVDLLGAQWFRLAPGTNALRYAGEDDAKAARIQVSWNDWYLGVG